MEIFTAVTKGKKSPKECKSKEQSRREEVEVQWQ
jgi:hypothetical protein